MFDSTKGKASSDARIEEASDNFASDFEEFLNDPTVSRKEKEGLIEEISKMVADRAIARAVAAGTHAQEGARANDGSSAMQIASGSSSPTSNIPSEDETREAIKIILKSPHLGNGYKHLIRRGYDQRTPDHIKVENDGTPTELKTARAEKATLERERDAAKQDLEHERDKSYTGSLAQKLEDAKSMAGSSTTPSADTVEKGKVKTALEAIEQIAKDAVGGGKYGRMTTSSPVKKLSDGVTDRVDQAKRDLL